MILEKGGEGDGPSSYTDARIAVSSLGVLVVGGRESDTASGMTLWFSTDGETWIESELSPPGRHRILGLGVVSPSPEGLLLAGITGTDVEADRAVTMWAGDGIDWNLVDDTSAGLPGLVSQFLDPWCLCGLLTSLVPFGSGYLAAGLIDGRNTVWTSADGVLWEPTSLGGGDGVVGLATLDQRAFALGTALGPVVWRSDDGESWEVIADASAFGLPGISPGRDSGAFEGVHEPGQALGLTSDGESLLALLSIRVRRGDDWCEASLADCNHSTLALFRSPDGVTWERLWLPEEYWNYPWGELAASFQGRTLFAEAADGRLQVWASEDPGAARKPTAREEFEAGPFVALKVRLDAEAGGFRALEIADWTGIRPPRLDTWEPVDLTLQGVQTEVTAVIEAGSSYTGSGDTFAPNSEVSTIAMPYGREHQLQLDLAESPLPPGLHTFLLSIPIWITRNGVPEGAPDGVARLHATYNVFDQERADRVRDFCEVAIPLVNGLRPSNLDLDDISEAAEGRLEEPIAKSLASAIDGLRGPLLQGYDTSPLVEAVGDACGRYDLFAEVAIFDY